MASVRVQCGTVVHTNIEHYSCAISPMNLQTWNTTNNLHKQNMLYTGLFECFQGKSRENLENLHNIS